MDEAIEDILAALGSADPNSKDFQPKALDAKTLDKIIRKHSKLAKDGRKVFAKKHILAYFLEAQKQNSPAWSKWNLSDAEIKAFVEALRVKPRRTASGVATITVITKPAPCSGQCIFCPNDISMPKSYLRDEPACQRALLCHFDPYLQVASRLRALGAMGHPSDKVELIILGGTWTDYSKDYRHWYILQLFEALNDSSETREAKAQQRTAVYERQISSAAPEAKELTSLQEAVNKGALTYNEAIAQMPCFPASLGESVALSQIEEAHKANETADHRCVGLVVETRPDAITAKALEEIRFLGGTKIQLGIQSLRSEILEANGRPMDISVIAQALDLCRLYGFKTHVHFMVNLKGATAQSDYADYERLVNQREFQPDEIKLYPCSLVDGTPLVEEYRQGRWTPYDEATLVNLLARCLEATPCFTRISRMIRDISSKDIMVGNKKTNLRQMVESAALGNVEEIRWREVATEALDLEALSLECIAYDTLSTKENFLQWVSPEGKIAGFLRLSLPSVDVSSESWASSLGPKFHITPTDEFLYFNSSVGLLQNLSNRSSAQDPERTPLASKDAMIREVHIYGFAAKLNGEETSAQHRGLGKALIAEAEAIAKEAGYAGLKVISAIGTRQYYRSLGFCDSGLYQRKEL